MGIQQIRKSKVVDHYRTSAVIDYPSIIDPSSSTFIGHDRTLSLLLYIIIYHYRPLAFINIRRRRFYHRHAHRHTHDHHCHIGHCRHRHHHPNHRHHDPAECTKRLGWELSTWLETLCYHSHLLFESFLDASASKVPTKLHENQYEMKLAKHAVDRIEVVLLWCAIFHILHILKTELDRQHYQVTNIHTSLNDFVVRTRGRRPPDFRHHTY